MTAAAPHAPLLTATGIVKRFPGVLALDRLDLTIRGGEIVALLGCNGAGKSTIMQILAGVHPHGSYEGTITLGGHAFAAASVTDARARGIALVAQEVNVVGELTVAENMFLGAEPRLGRFPLSLFLDEPARLARARAALADFGVDVDASAPMASLDLATQQLVTIAAALARDARLLILDEPTAALTDKEAQRLFERMRALRARGVSCIFVSHRLAEVFAVADRIVVMRDGRVSGVYPPDAGARDEVVRAMLGGAIAEGVSAAPSAQMNADAGALALEVTNLEVRDPDGARRPRVSGLGLAVARGEILGLFGLLGAGCGEAALAIFGAWEGPVTGRVLVDGRQVRIREPADAVAHGLGLVAQDRRQSLVHEHTVAENIVMASLPGVTRRGFLDVAAMRRVANDYVARLAIKVPSVDTHVGTCSGGNQQKVQVARWLASGATILLLVDPTRGIDVGTRREISALWRQLAAEGHALLLVSSDAEELVEVCDRVLVLRAGVLAGELPRAELDEERLLRHGGGRLMAARSIDQRTWQTAWRNSTLLFVVAVVWIVFQVTTDGTFLTQRNLVLLALQTSIVSLAAISAVMLIVTRNFDLSVGSAVALVGVVVAVLTVKHDVHPALAVGAALAVGVALGAWQGLWVTRMGVSSFIVTLAGMLYFRGLSMIATDGATIAPLPDSLADLATGFLPPAPAIALLVLAVAVLAAFQVMGARRARALGVIERVGPAVARGLAPFLVGAGAFAWLASRQGIPYLVLLVAAAAIVAEIVMRRTPFGVQLYAIGGNPEAARLSGIRLRRVVFIDFLIAGLAYGVTGVALTARVGGAVAGSAGLFLELDAISAAIIGGTSLTGGRGRVFGALVGALLMGSLNNGMSLMNVPTFYQETARGVVLLLAVAADQLRNKRRS